MNSKPTETRLVNEKEKPKKKSEERGGIKRREALFTEENQISSRKQRGR